VNTDGLPDRTMAFGDARIRTWPG